MELKITRSITRRQESQLKVLYENCLAADPVSVTPLASAKDLAGIVTFLLYDGEELAAFLSSYEVDEETLEINAFTSPAWRKKGCFAHLYQAMLAEYPEEKRRDITFQCDERSKDVQGFLSHLACPFEETEYLLVCRDPRSKFPTGLKKPDPRILEFSISGCGDLDLLAKVHAHVFDQSEEESREFLNEIKVIPGIRYQLISYHGIPAGIYFLQVTMERTYLFGFGIVPEIQGKGYSDVIMRHIFHNLPMFCTEVTVQVSKSNERAFHVYQKYGFEISEALSIYHMPADYAGKAME